MKEIKIELIPGGNFTPSALMKRYADKTPGVAFTRGYFGNAQLVIEERIYQYHHWSITAENDVEIVTLYLEEVIKHEQS